VPSWRDFLKRPAGRSTAQSAPTSTQTAEPTEEPAEKPAEKPAETPAEKPAEKPPATRSEEPATQQRQAAPEEVPEQKPEPKAEKKASETPAAKPAERPAKKEAPVAKTTQEKQEKEPGRGRETGKKVVAGANALRTRIASIVWLVAVICAAVLAVAALMVALKLNPDNAIVKFITDFAKAIDFGKFKDFTGKGAATKEALTNYGISAVIYLVVGKILDRIIRP
jgi:hypothetical protein